MSFCNSVETTIELAPHLNATVFRCLTPKHYPAEHWSNHSGQMASCCLFSFIAVPLLVLYSVTGDTITYVGLHQSFLGYDMKTREPLHPFQIVRKPVGNDVQLCTTTLRIAPQELVTPSGSAMVNLTWTITDLRSESANNSVSKSHWIGMYSLYVVCTLSILVLCHCDDQFSGYYTIQKVRSLLSRY